MTDASLIRRPFARPTTVAAVVGAFLLAAPMAHGGTAVPKRAERRLSAQSKVVVSCLRRVHLQHVFASSSALWVGWDPKVEGFIYVQKYPTAKAADAEARFLSSQESGVAGKLLINEHITPFKGSPVPSVVKCLGGRMVSKTPSSGGGVYKF